MTQTTQEFVACFRLSSARTRSVPLILLTTLLWLLLSSIALAGVDEQIEKISAQLEAESDNATLWLHRGRLFMEAERWTEAADDLRRAYELEPRQSSTLFFLARVQMELDDAPAGLLTIGTYLDSLGEKQQGARYRGEMLKGDLLTALDRLEPASKAYGRALAVASSPKAEDFLTHAEALLAADRPDEAVQTLDAGSARLRSADPLQLRSLEILVEQGKLQEAIGRAVHLTTQSKPAMLWWVELGDLHHLADDLPSAATAYRKALQEIGELPAGRRGIPAMVELEARAKSGLEETSESGPGERSGENNR